MPEFNEEEFNAVAYSYRSWPGTDPAGVVARYDELVAHVKELMHYAWLEGLDDARDAQDD